jgi:hypothetical protein
MEAPASDDTEEAPQVAGFPLETFRVLKDWEMPQFGQAAST